MGGVVRATTVQNEAGTITIPTRYFSSRIIQRTAYTSRIGWWRGNNSYYWVPGAYIDFRPMRDDTRIKISFMIPTRDYGSAHMISHWIFYRDDIEYGRHTRGGHHVENPFTQEWDLESWGAGQYARVGYKFRAYSEGNHNAHLYHARYWDGAGSGLNMPGQVIVEEYIPPDDGTVVEVFRATTTSTWTAPEGVTAVDVLVVGGGGGGGMDMGGGGGAGGVRYQANYPVTPGSNYRVVVGRGGYGAPGGSQFRDDGVGPQPGAHNFSINATKGGDSQFALLVSDGGGYGGSSYYTSPLGGTPGDGGSGGGRGGYSNDNTVRAGGLGIAGQGFNGGQGGPAYYSGGGGGAGGAGANSTNQPNGGPGVANSIMGRTYYFGGGGAGAGYSIEGGLGGIGGGGGGAVGPNKTGGIGGLNPGGRGGGGARNAQSNRPGGNAGANTGGGGGGGSHYNANNSGGNGGSGIVVIRYRPAASALV